MKLLGWHELGFGTMKTINKYQDNLDTTLSWILSRWHVL